MQFTAPSLGKPLALSVAGIYETGIDRLDRGIAFCPLSALPNPAGEWSAAVFLVRGGSTQKVPATYERKFTDTGTTWDCTALRFDPSPISMTG